jgi:uncharacterized protein
MMVILHSVLEHNRLVHDQTRTGPRASILAIDPHDEFRTWHANSGGADGVRGIVQRYSPQERHALVEPFYYLSAQDLEPDGLERRITLSRADVIPDDLHSIAEFSEQQIAFTSQQFNLWGEDWIRQVLMGDVEGPMPGLESNASYLPGTVGAVQRRLGFLRRGHTQVFTPFDRDGGEPYQSTLPDLVCALERGRVVIVDTTLMGEFEQFLLNTVVARTMFSLRRTLRNTVQPEQLPEAIRQAFRNDDTDGLVGQRTLAEALIQKLETGDLPYIIDGRVTTPNELPFVNVVIEEAPSVLNPERLRFGSVFRDISRQGRKFGIGLSVVSQQVSEIDSGILTQLNTELIMPLGNEEERQKAIKNASSDMMGFERELQVMARGQVIVSASYKDVPLPVQIPNFDDLVRE